MGKARAWSPVLWGWGCGLHSAQKGRSWKPRGRPSSARAATRGGRLRAHGAQCQHLCSLGWRGYGGAPGGLLGPHSHLPRSPGRQKQVKARTRKRSRADRSQWNVDFQPQLTVSGRDLKSKRTDPGVEGAWGERVWEDPSGETVDKKQGGSGGRRETSEGLRPCGKEATLKPQVCLLGRDTWTDPHRADLSGLLGGVRDHECGQAEDACPPGERHPRDDAHSHLLGCMGRMCAHTHAHACTRMHTRVHTRVRTYAHTVCKRVMGWGSPGRSVWGVSTALWR